MSHLNKSILISLIICLGLGISFAALAEEASKPIEVIEDEAVKAEDLEIKEPKLLPDSNWYFIKELGRGIQSFFTFGQIKKSELEQKFASERLMELRKLAEKDADPKMLEKAIEKYERALERIQTRTENIKDKAKDNEEVNKFLDKFTKHQLLHQRVLQKLETQVSKEVFEKIQETREKHLEKFGQVMIKLEDRTEEIQEKLENNLEDIKGSKFKNFKNLEILIELEEKVPEQAKEAIRNAQENALKRLKGDLEKMSLENQERFKQYIDKISGNKEIQSQILERVKQRIQNQVQLKEKLNDAQEGILERLKINIREQEQPNTSACITLWNPICGEDKKTYSNACFARQAEVEIDYKGKCEIKPVSKCKEMTINEALNIALSSECAQKAKLSSKVFCNENTGTWWIDVNPFETKAGCNPACVVNVITKQAEINWRCTGAIVPAQ